METKSELRFATNYTIIDYRGARSAPGLETSNHFDPSAPRPQTVRLIGGNRY